MSKMVLIKNKELAPFQPILEEWTKCVQEYIDCWEGGDLPYWYNERANVSVLAGAAWRAGFTAIEEYQIKKQGVTSDKDSNGRNDLYITDKNFGIAIEAKVLFPKIDELDSQISTAIKNAISDVKKIKAVDGHRAGVVFIAPYTTSIATDEQVKLFSQHIAAINNVDAYAFICPQTNNPKSHDEKYYPCAAVLIFWVDESFL